MEEWKYGSGTQLLTMLKRYALSVELKKCHMKKLGNYVTGRWIEGDGDLQILADAVTGIPFIRPGPAALIFRIYFNMPEQWEIRHCAK